VGNTSLTVNSSAYVVSPGYPSRMNDADLQCSCLIQAMSTNDAQVYFTVRYIDWKVDTKISSCWSTLIFKTYDIATNLEFCISDEIEIPLINRTLTTGLLVNFWREKTWTSRSGYFQLEINAAGIIFESV